jgi:hypothetical protein
VSPDNSAAFLARTVRPTTAKPSLRATSTTGPSLRASACSTASRPT